ncbi:hypothetical protein NLM24_12755 [Nocardia zapadnayensis]|uniref:hypothetical protein n=1 Tax=Nocardia rhamnosiphila TaxID=426716 RepID=UPI002246B27F|nr:hypothetical protein [Nocardia zapadnayensis]MCX0271561.1 hypothetical protein [Nocardia zapadnayensis]
MRELVDTGNTLEAACHIVILEDHLAQAQRLNTDLQHTLDQRTDPDTDTGKRTGPHHAPTSSTRWGSGSNRRDPDEGSIYPLIFVIYR